MGRREDEDLLRRRMDAVSESNERITRDGKVALGRAQPELDLEKRLKAVCARLEALRRRKKQR